MFHKFFQEVELGSRMERQKLELLHKLDRAFTRTEEQIYKVAVEIVVNVHAADFRLHTEQERTAATKGFKIELWGWREHLPDVRDQLFLAADPRNEWSSDPGHPRPRVR